MPATFPCPQCRVVLKPTKPVPPGKKVKCPKCGYIFVTAAAQAPANTGMQQKSRAPAPAAPVEDLAEEGWELIEEEEPATPPASKLPTAELIDDQEPEDDEEEQPRGRRPGTPKTRRRQDYDDEDEEDDQDYDDDDDGRPLRRPAGKRKSSASRTLLKLYLAMIGLTLLLIVGAAVGGLVWYLNAGRNRGTGNEDPLAFVLPDSNVVDGLNFPELMKEPLLGNIFEKQLKEDAPPSFFENVKQETGLEMADLCERTIVAFSAGPESNALGSNGILTKYTTLVFRSKTPFSQRKVRNCLKEPKGEKIRGKTVYRSSDSPKVLFMPSDRIIVLTDAPDNQLEVIVGSDGTTAALGPDVQSLVRNVENHQVWLIFPFSPATKNHLEKLNQGAPADFQPLLRNLTKSHGAAAGFTVSSGQAKLEIEVDYHDSADAKQFTKDVEGLWNRYVKTFQAQLFLNALPKEQASFFKEVLKTTIFSNEGSRARAITQFSAAGFSDFVQAAQAQAQQPGRMMPFMPAPGAGRAQPRQGPGAPAPGAGRPQPRQGPAR